MLLSGMQVLIPPTPPQHPLTLVFKLLFPSLTVPGSAALSPFTKELGEDKIKLTGIKYFWAIPKNVILLFPYPY
jgi:hypothetical protein